MHVSMNVCMCIHICVHVQHIVCVNIVIVLTNIIMYACHHAVIPTHLHELTIQTYIQI